MEPNKTPLRGLAGALAALLAVFAAAAPAFAWTDSPGTSTIIRKVHMDELRSAANAKTMSYGFPDHSASWTDPTITAGSTFIRAAHISEIRGWITVIRAFYGGVCPGQLPASPYNWTDPTLTAGSTFIRGVHITELRNYIDAIGSADNCCAVCKYPAGYSGCQNIGYGGTDTGCSGSYYCDSGCSGGSTNYNCWSYADRSLCDGSGNCTYQVAQDCNAGFCSGGAIYYYAGCDATNGCNTPTISYYCTASDYCYNPNWYHYMSTCVGSACGYEYHNCTYYTEKVCSGGNLYTYNGCSGNTCPIYPYPIQYCSGYYCGGSGQDRYQYTGCSGGACTATYLGSCGGGAVYCSDSCNLTHPNSCNPNNGACETWNEDCCSYSSIGYCSGGACYS